MTKPDGLCISCGEPAGPLFRYHCDAPACWQWSVTHALVCPADPCPWCHVVAGIEAWCERLALEARLREQA